MRLRIRSTREIRGLSVGQFTSAEAKARERGPSHEPRTRRSFRLLPIESREARLRRSNPWRRVGFDPADICNVFANCKGKKTFTIFSQRARIATLTSSHNYKKCDGTHDAR
jgi:hypothetical protein